MSTSLTLSPLSLNISIAKWMHHSFCTSRLLWAVRSVNPSNSWATCTYLSSSCRPYIHRVLNRENFLHHGLCGSNKLLYKRWALSMGNGELRPPTAPKFLDRSFWNSNLRNKSRGLPNMQNMVQIGIRGWATVFGSILCFLVFFAPRPGHTAGPISTRHGS